MLSRLRETLTKYVGDSVRHAIRALIIGIIIGLIVGEALGFALETGWPRQPFAHVVAVVIAFILGYGLFITTVLWAVLKGIVEVTLGLENVAKDAAKVAGNDGLNIIDTVVDALDGPNRHGIR